MLFNKVIYFLFLTLFLHLKLIACTTAVVAGKCTKDGRPLLWKHRDSNHFKNKLMYFNDGQYSYIGLINSEDSLGSEIWAGSNSAGFSIMNSASYNLNIGDTTKLKDQEGELMKQALQSCASIAEFEQLLNRTSTSRGIEANFGVIDAFGGAAYFETGNLSYTKFDANDPKVAPFGYIIRTNYSVTGQIDAGYGYIRYLTTENLFYEAAAQQEISYAFILQKGDRNLYHSLTKIDLSIPPFPYSKEKSHFVCFQDYINRYTSVSSMVIQGVKQEESVELTTIWTVLGFPLCSVAIPTWVAGGEKLPEVTIAAGSKDAP